MRFLTSRGSSRARDNNRGEIESNNERIPAGNVRR